MVYADTLLTRYLKKLCGLCKSADVNRMFLPQQYGGLGMPVISTLYKSTRVSKACQLMLSSDKFVQDLAYQQAKNKAQLSRPSFKPHTQAKTLLPSRHFSSRHNLMTAAKKLSKDNVIRLTHSQASQNKGRCFVLTQKLLCGLML